LQIRGFTCNITGFNTLQVNQIIEQGVIMTNVYHVGLDVHKETADIAVFKNWNQDSEYEKHIQYDERRIIEEVLSLQEKGSVTVCYEAGCMGFTLQRYLEEAGIRCMVIAPGKMPRRPGERIKNDRRDARKLAKLLKSGEAEGIHIPTPEDEAVRDYLRARGDIKDDLKRARQRLSKFLLRTGYRYMEKHWTMKHRKWMDNLSLGEMQRETFAMYYYYIQELEEKLYGIDLRIDEIAQSERYNSRVSFLRCLKGVDYLTALAFVCEVGDFRRFRNAKSFMAYLGLVPGERSSGGTRRQGSITKAGNSHLRTLLIESSWHYRYKAPASRRLSQRRVGISPDIVVYADRAMHRLQQKFFKLVLKGKPGQVAVTAVARELAGFMWGLMTNNVA
jgi:transposase